MDSKAEKYHQHVVLQWRPNLQTVVQTYPGGSLTLAIINDSDWSCGGISEDCDVRYVVTWILQFVERNLFNKLSCELVLHDTRA